VAQRDIGRTELVVEPPSGDHDKRARRHRKREEKLHRDAVRPPRSFERFRILAELVSEGRQVVEIADHKARYAIIVLGVVNAAMYLVITRAHLVNAVAPAIKPWLTAALAAYAVLTFLFLLHAIDCLRPRRLGGAALLPERQSLLCWDAVASTDLAAYRAAWMRARMDQINDEAVVIAHRESRILDAKYRALGRLYAGLSVLVLLGGVLLAALAGAAFFAGER
jgi:hypothetical protein